MSANTGVTYSRIFECNILFLYDFLIEDQCRPSNVSPKRQRPRKMPDDPHYFDDDHSDDSANGGGGKHVRTT